MTIEKQLAAIEARQKQAHETVCALCRGDKWTMSVPAEPERDSDFVIDASLSDIPKLVALIRDLSVRERDYRDVLCDIAAFGECQCDKERDKQTGDLYSPCVVCRARTLAEPLPDAPHTGD